jgi:hypothetical protein
MARPAFVVNEALREKVRHLAGLGVPQDDIARIVGCAPKTLRKRFRDELDRGAAEANAIIAGSLFSAAKAGNIAAAIFWMKTRAHWRERPPTEIPIVDADAASSSEVVLVLPDNNRDPEPAKHPEAPPPSSGGLLRAPMCSGEIFLLSVLHCGSLARRMTDAVGRQDGNIGTTGTADRVSADPGGHLHLRRRTTPQITNPGGLWDESLHFYPRFGGTAHRRIQEWRKNTALKLGTRRT